MEIPTITIKLEEGLLPFLGDALSWLTGTAATKDVNNIKKRVSQLIEAHSAQQETWFILYPSLMSCNMQHK